MPGRPSSETNVMRARRAWGDPLPRWVAVLANKCDRNSRTRASEALGISSATISRLLSKSYGASTVEMERLVLAELAADTVACPVAGEIALRTCTRNRRRKGVPVNFLHHTFARACPACPNNSDKD